MINYFKITLEHKENIWIAILYNLQKNLLDYWLNNSYEYEIIELINYLEK